MKNILSLLAIFSLLALPAQAATRTWDRGAGTNAWATNLNWGNSSYPVSTDLVQINLASGPVITTTGNTSAEVRLGTTSGGTGNLTISGGGVLTSSGYGHVGYFSGTTTPSVTAGGTGSVTVTGTGSLWTTGTNGITLGTNINSTGTLTISAGGAVTDYTGVIANGVSSSGTATVTGANSIWTNTSDLTVGGGGAGVLNVAAAGKVLMARLYAGAAVGSNGQIFVDGAGSVITASDGMRIGQSGTGALTISNGGQVQNNNSAALAVVGNSAGSVGSVTVTGTNSKWLNGNGLTVGNLGSGTMLVSAGGQVTSTYGSISNTLGTTSAVTVTGASSSWTNSSTLNVGYGGAGTLSIANGGQVSDTTGTVGANAGSNGGVTVDGTGSKWINSGSATIGNSGTGTLTVSAGGLLSSVGGNLGYYSGSNGYATVTGASSSWTSTGDMQIGRSGTGSLTVSAGAQVSNVTGYIGNLAGSTGAVSVTGTGSLWSNSAGLNIGTNNSVTSTLNITLGGKVTDTTAFIAANAGSAGSVTVNGSTSSWVNSSELNVANGGTGSLNIEAGAKVSNTVGYIGRVAGSNGTAIVTGTGSLWSNTGDLNVGRTGTGALTISAGGKVTNAAANIGSFTGGVGTVSVLGATSSWVSSGLLSVGANGTGTLTVTSGAQVSSAGGGSIGANAGAIGTATISGAGSTWTNSNNVNVAYSGTGSLTINSAGQVEDTTGYIGYSSGSSGTATVTGTNSSWTNSVDMVVGRSGSGTLIISNGGRVSDTLGTIGFNTGSTGTATVTGTNSTWTNSSDLTVGIGGTASLYVTAGGQAIAAKLSAGAGTGSNGQVLVDGVGSSITASNGLRIGQYGIGALTISNGGQVVNNVSTAAAVIGNLVGSNGSVTVTGTNSKLLNNTLLTVGSVGMGSLTISNGAQVTSTASTLGLGTGGHGLATLTGAGSSWVNTGDLYIGNNGTGTVTVSNSALLSVGLGPVYNYEPVPGLTPAVIVPITPSATIFIAQSTGSVGTLNIGAALGSAAVASGTLNATTVAFGDGTGSLVFNHTDSNYTFSQAITGNGTIDFVAGDTTLTGDMSGFTGTIIGNAAITLDTGGETSVNGDSSAFTGTTTVGDGSLLRVNGSLGGTTVVEDGGRLQGHGTVDDLTINSGGTVAPGNSIGTLSVTDATFAPGSTYEVEVNGAGQSDQIVASNTITINGGAVHVQSYPVGVYPNFAPGRYTILSAANSLTGTFDTLTDDWILVNSALSYDANNTYLTLQRNAASAAVRPNQRAVAGGLDTLGTTANDAVNALYVLGTAMAAQTALDQLSGEIHASLASTVLASQSLVRDAVTSDNADLSLNNLDGGRLWLKGVHDWATTQRSAVAANTDSTTNDVMIGAETRVDGGDDATDSVVLGLALGVGRTDVQANELGSRGRADSTQAVLYAKQRDGAWSTTMGAGAGWQEISTRRDVMFTGFSGRSQADYSAQSAQVFARLGYDLALDTDLMVTPYGAAAYGLYHTDRFTETGTASLTGEERTTTLPTSTLGVDIKQDITLPLGEKLNLNGGLGWQHAWSDTSPEAQLAFTNAGGASSSPYRVQGAPIARDALLLNAGVGFAIDADTSVNLSYAAQLGAITTSQSVQARVGVKF